jgi:putative ABC transport system permease protein
MLRSLLAHKLRLLLSAVAVVLGTLFMSAAFVAGDTIAQGFQQLFTTVNEGLDVQVTAEPPISNGQGAGVVTAFVDQATAGKVAAVPGVARSVPNVISNGARVIGKNGKVVGTTGPPRDGLGWTGDMGRPGNLIELRGGRAPAAPDEIAINAALARTTGFQLGDRVDVLTLQPRRTFRLVGILGFRGGRDTLGGETTVAFTLPVAQQLMLGRTGVFTNVDVTAAPGVSPAELKARVASAIGPGFVVRTGAETAREQGREVAAFTGVLKNGLVVFALIGLFTGAFLIFNTFSMLVAQRLQELALYRAFGASRGQVNRSVLIESILVGLGSSILGLLLGIGIGYALVQGLEAIANASLPVSGVTVRPYAIITTLLVGTVITILAATVPSLRASRVPPIAAIREASLAERPLRMLTAAGALVFAAGAGLLAVKLTDTVKGNLALLLGAGGVLAFLGVAMLAPVLSRPFTALLGFAFGSGVAARLGTRNTGRNPRRTAVTATALMIGVTLATGAGIFVTSAKAGVTALFRKDLNAELGVTSDLTAGTTAGFDPALAARMRAIPGVQAALALQVDRVQLAGAAAMVSATDVGAATTIFRLTPKEGELRPLNAGEILLDERTARDRRFSVGDTLTMRTSRGGDSIERVVGIFARNQIVGGPLVSPAETKTFTSPLAQQGFVKVADRGQVAPVRAQLDRLFAGDPEISVVDSSALLAQQNRLLDVILGILYVLLGLTILVAILGVINTLLLSVFERTRELGLLRAVGLGRGQLGRMITVESILISVFGTLLGIAAGVALGVAIVSALDSSGYLRLTVSWTYLVITLALAILAGVIAAILPAIRAARLNVLHAIAYE